MPGPVFIDGEAVTLRTLERDDLDLLHRSRNDPAIRPWLTFETPSTMDDIESFYESTILDDGNLNLVVCIDGEPAGTVVLFDISRHSAELAAWLFPEYHGEGYGREATTLVLDHGFADLGVHRIRAKALADNDPSRGLIRSLGFTEVGVARDAVFQRGEYRDMVRYDLLSDEWFTSR
ncbi:MAG: GNAT family protein [Halobacteriales archaeon]|nr:GNAT family protein [Halobacteriales archaeon]